MVFAACPCRPAFPKVSEHWELAGRLVCAAQHLGDDCVGSRLVGSRLETPVRVDSDLGFVLPPLCVAFCNASQSCRHFTLQDGLGLGTVSRLLSHA